MKFTLAGIVIDDKFMQPLKAPLSIIATVFGTLIFSRFTQQEKEFLPMFVTPLGMLIVFEMLLFGKYIISVFSLLYNTPFFKVK